MEAELGSVKLGCGKRKKFETKNFLASISCQNSLEIIISGLIWSSKKSNVTARYSKQFGVPFRVFAQVQITKGIGNIAQRN